jgi:tRNA uridine 5-carboxymethylaminomethyl modification enzyme
MEELGTFDVIVVGGGHAGCEAAAAAARMGVSVALVTLKEETIGEMPCNPAVGGVGKGQITVEVDALGGIQGWAADRAGIQFKMLNSSKGPAVWGPRAQCDKVRYRELMRRMIRGMTGIRLIEGEVKGVMDGERCVEGVHLGDGRSIRGRCVILTTGTFLGGVLHTGLRSSKGGRIGEAPSIGLSESMRELGIGMRRFKTGTPPRLRRESIDFSRITAQEGDAEPRPFSWRTREVRNIERCWVTRTPRVVQKIIEDNLDSSPLYTGRIQGVGPRYCPSIEDKVVRFPHHEEHTIFLEPEGVENQSIYVNGLSTSLSREVQEMVVRAIPGCEQAQIIRYGYAVEYDVVAPLQVKRSLETGVVGGLYVAGQLLGTSGYEEAAAQGFIAGVNAARSVRGEETFALGRDQAYIGVLIDDLVSRQHEEPYRMLTSRAEHRIVLGIDSARERLMEIGVKLGLVPEKMFHVEHRRWQRRRHTAEELESTHLNPDSETRRMVSELAGVEITARTSWAGLLRRQDIDPEEIAGSIPGLAELPADERRIVIGRLRYRGYLERHQRELDRIRRLREVRIPSHLLYRDVPGLSREVVEKLERFNPRTLAEAEVIPGMTPAAIAIIAGRISRSHGPQDGDR